MMEELIHIHWFEELTANIKRDMEAYVIREIQRDQDFENKGKKKKKKKKKKTERA